MVAASVKDHKQYAPDGPADGAIWPRQPLHRPFGEPSPVVLKRAATTSAEREGSVILNQGPKPTLISLPPRPKGQPHPVLTLHVMTFCEREPLNPLSQFGRGSMVRPAKRGAVQSVARFR